MAKRPMTREQIERAASAFLEGRLGRRLKLIGAKQAFQQPGEWNVLFESTDKAGRPMDGPTLVVVNERTGAVRLFETL